MLVLHFCADRPTPNAHTFHPTFGEFPPQTQFVCREMNSTPRLSVRLMDRRCGNDRIPSRRNSRFDFVFLVLIALIAPLSSSFASCSSSRTINEARLQSCVIKNVKMSRTAGNFVQPQLQNRDQPWLPITSCIRLILKGEQTSSVLCLATTADVWVECP